MFMRNFLPAAIAILACMHVADAGPQLMNKLVQKYQKNTYHQLSPQGNCTKQNIARRKEWYACPLLGFP